MHGTYLLSGGCTVSLVSCQLPGREVGHAGHAHVLHGRREHGGVLALVLAGERAGRLHVHLGKQGPGLGLVMLGGRGRV